MKRLDDLNRTERFFTSTLLGGLFFHNGLSGVREFLEWFINEKEVLLHVVGEPTSKIPFILPAVVPEHIEVNTEFNTKRDIKHYHQSLTDHDGVNPSQKQNVPDMVIIYGETLIVIEGKFFVSGQSPSDIDQQLFLQKEEIQLMIDYLNPQIKYWLHVYLGPTTINLVNCDLQLTWKEIEQFSAKLLGDGHYITERLHNANHRYFATKASSSDKSHYSGKCSLPEIIRLCESEGEQIIVGFEGGINRLTSSDYKNFVNRDFKWDQTNNLSGKTRSNWLDGALFLKTINQLAQGSNAISKDRILNSAPKSRNYIDTANLNEINTLCNTHREKILIGFTGGKASLQSASMKELESRKFKYDFKNELQGKKTLSNWINGKVFQDIISQK